MSFNAIHKNKILTKISDFTVECIFIQLIPTIGGLLLRSPGLYKNSYAFHPPSLELLPSMMTSGRPPTPVIL